MLDSVMTCILQICKAQPASTGEEDEMAIAAAKVSPRNQLSLPKGVRKALGIGPGDTVLFIVEGGQVRLLRRPPDLTDYTYGLGKEAWEKLGGGEAFLREERATWEQ